MSRWPSFTLGGKRYLVIPHEEAAAAGLTRETTAQRRRRATAARLRAAREAAGLTQAELAARMGVGQPSIARVEGEHDNVSDARATAWLEACGFDKDWTGA